MGDGRGGQRPTGPGEEPTWEHLCLRTKNEVDDDKKRIKLEEVELPSDITRLTFNSFRSSIAHCEEKKATSCLLTQPFSWPA